MVPPRLLGPRQAELGSSGGRGFRPCHQGQRQQSLGSSGGLGIMSVMTRANIVREAPVDAAVFCVQADYLGRTGEVGGDVLWMCRRWWQAHMHQDREWMLEAWTGARDLDARRVYYLDWAANAACSYMHKFAWVSALWATSGMAVC